MRHHASSSLPLPGPARGGDWRVIRTLIPYLWAYRSRVVAALLALVAAKVANVGVPLLLKEIVDSLDAKTAALAVPLALLAAYGLLRLSTTVFTELREFLFAKVTQRAVRTIALEVFRHLHALSLRFHLARQTGGLTRDVERGQRGISTLISFTLFSILPTLVEISLVAAILVVRYDWTFIAITLTALALYVAATILITDWRTGFRRQMNELDSKANTRAIDSLLNYETVKYFGNEAFEARRYDESMQRWEKAAVRSQTSLSLPQRHAERDHRRGRDADHVAGDRRRGRRHDDDRRSGARQRVHDPDLHPAQFPGRALSRGQAGAGRHGADVRADRRAYRGGRRAGRAGARRRRGGGPFRARRLRLRGEPADPVRRELHDPGRQNRGRRGPVRRRQEHALAAAVPLLRRDGRAHHGERTGSAGRAPGQPARGDRHRAAGHGAVQRQRSSTTSPTAAPARRTTRSSRRRSSRRSTPSSSAPPRATRRRSANAA